MMIKRISGVVPELVKKPRHTLIALAIAQAGMVSGAQAATLIVGSSADDNGAGCTLREAVQASNQGGVGSTGCINFGEPFSNSSQDLINISPLLNSITLNEDLGPLVLTGNMEIVSTNDVTIQGQGGAAFNDRLMDIQGPSNVSLVGLTFTGAPVNGGASGSVIRVKDNAIFSMRDSTITGAEANGGALSIQNGTTAVLRNTIITGHHATGGTGGAGIEVTGTNTGTGSTLRLYDSTISDNTANNVGGGILLDFESSASIYNSTISGNSANYGAGIISRRDSNLTLSQSTVSGNSAGGTSGGRGGGVVVNSNGKNVIANSTISGNTALISGGGVYLSGLETSVSIINSTITNNSAITQGGNIDSFGGEARLSNSIVANAFGADDCGGNATIIADRHNIIEDGSCNTGALNIDPRLGPLTDNGGATYTHALLTGSPAISAGSDAVCAANPINSVDQRGEPRSNPVDTICDLGAFESPEGRAAPLSNFFVIPIKNGKTVIVEL